MGDRYPRAEWRRFGLYQPWQRVVSRANQAAALERIFLSIFSHFTSRRGLRGSFCKVRGPCLRLTVDMLRYVSPNVPTRSRAAKNLKVTRRDRRTISAAFALVFASTCVGGCGPSLAETVRTVNGGGSPWEVGAAGPFALIVVPEGSFSPVYLGDPERPEGDVGETLMSVHEDAELTGRARPVEGVDGVYLVELRARYRGSSSSSRREQTVIARIHVGGVDVLCGWRGDESQDYDEPMAGLPARYVHRARLDGEGVGWTVTAREEHRNYEGHQSARVERFVLRAGRCERELVSFRSNDPDEADETTEPSTASDPR